LIKYVTVREIMENCRINNEFELNKVYTTNKLKIEFKLRSLS